MMLQVLIRYYLHCSGAQAPAGDDREHDEGVADGGAGPDPRRQEPPAPTTPHLRGHAAPLPHQEGKDMS